MNVDMFNPRSLTQATLQMKPARTFFRDRFFGGNVEEHNSLLIDLDIYKGKRKVAPYSRASTKATPLERNAWQRTPVHIPYIKLKRSLEAVQTALVQPGEHMYSGRTQAERARIILAKDLFELNDAIVRAEEMQAVQAITTGIVLIKGEEIDAEVNYGRSGSHVYTVGTLWTANGSDPGDDLRDAARLILKDTGKDAKVAVFGSDALTAFLKHPLVLDQLDTLNGTFGRVSGTNAPMEGATYYGTFQGFEIWGYEEWYLDDADNTEKPFITADRVYVTAASANNVVHYGPIQHFGALIPLKRFVTSWEEQDPSVRFCAMHSAPLYVPHDIDATVSMEVA